MKTPTLVLALFALGCASEIDDKTAATVAEAPPPSTPAAAPEAAPEAAGGAPAALEVPEGALKLGAASSLEWVGAKITKDHPGGFKALDGYAVVDGDALRSARLVIDMKSTFSDAAKLTKHLMDEDFFFVDQHPTSTFDITGVAAGAEAPNTHMVTGSLTLRGVTKEISFPATVTVAGDSATMAAEFTLNRQDFGIAYAGRPDDLIRDDVLVKGSLTFGG